MRTLLFLIALASAACTTRPNEGVCCVSEADCARLGVDEPRPCEVGQACKAFACVAAECATSAECTSPDAPVCIDGLCVASCRGDDDCAGAAGGSRCAEDGACVGCLGNADCPVSAPFCDDEDRGCRGCELDAECASGVCIEAGAVCAEPGELVHVKNDGVDAGGCIREAACRTLSYALQQVTAQRSVVRVSGSILDTPPGTIVLDRPVVIDGADTMISKGAGMPLFSIGMSVGVVTLEGLRLVGSGNPPEPTITVADGSSLHITRSVLDTAVIDVVGGGLELRDARVTTALPTARAVRCSNGTVSVRAVDFEHATVQATNCHLDVSRCRFDEIVDGSISADGGVAIIENNLVVQAYELADSMYVVNMAPGSTVRFNTVVNTSGMTGDGTALYCDATVEVTSNIFAYGSTHPLGGSVGMCRPTYSLFDTIAVPEHSMGQGDVVADAATLFVDRTALDFHLSATSPAKGAAAPGTTITVDLDGSPRPAPVGSNADIGCFEAP